MDQKYPSNQSNTIAHNKDATNDTRSNHEKFVEQGRMLFLEYDQEELLRKYPLDHDDAYIYINFCGRPYQIDRKDGRIYNALGNPAGFGATMTIYDMITRSPHPPVPTGKWATMTDLLAKCSGVGPASLEMFARDFRCFEGHVDELREACVKAGGRLVKGGDVSCIFPVFDNFDIWFQFWDSDEEFPSSISFLWDDCAIDHLHYETLWYVMRDILVILRRVMEGSLH